jgi:hypothetical protein
LLLTEAANQLHEAGGLSRWHLQASLLTGDPPEDTARACDLPVAVVTTYGAVFFDVVGRLDARDYIVQHAIGRRLFQGLRPDDHEALLKLAGFSGGRLALDAVRRAFSRPAPRLEELASLDCASLHARAEDVRCQLWILMHTLPLSAFAPGRLRALQALSDAVGALDRGSRPVTTTLPALALPALESARTAEEAEGEGASGHCLRLESSMDQALEHARSLSSDRPVA